MTVSNAELAKRADLALSNLSTDGGLLNPEQANTFIDMVLDTPTIVKQCRVERMNAPEKKINRIGFTGRVLRAAPQGSSPYAADDGTNDRYLAAANRVKPTTSQITLTSKEYLAEAHIPYSIFEDNIEGQSLESHLMQSLAKSVSKDIEEFALFSDTGSGDAEYALQDGWLKRFTANVVDNASAGVNTALFKNGLLTMPQKYLRDLNDLKHFVSVANTIKYRDLLSQRGTGLGDTMLVSNAPLYSAGVQIEAAPMLTADGSGNKGLLTYPKNLIMGVQRQINIETDRDIRARMIIIVMTLRLAFQVDDAAAGVKYISI